MAEDKIKSLYNAFVSDGYDMEPEAEFREHLKDSGKRRKAYDALVSDGYDMEPFAEFEANLGFGRQDGGLIESAVGKIQDIANQVKGYTEGRTEPQAPLAGQKPRGETSEQKPMGETTEPLAPLRDENRGGDVEGLEAMGAGEGLKAQEEGITAEREKAMDGEPLAAQEKHATSREKEERRLWKDPGMNIYLSKGGKRYLVPTSSIDAVGNLRDWQSAYDEEELKYAMTGPNGETKWATLDELDDLKAGGWIHNAREGEIPENERLIDSWKRSYRVRVGDEDILLPYDDVKMYGGLKGWAEAHPEKSIRVYMADSSGKVYLVLPDGVEEKVKDGWRISKVDSPENSGTPQEEYEPEKRERTLYVHVRRNGEDEKISQREINEFGGFEEYQQSHPGDELKIYMLSSDGKREAVGIEEIRERLKKGWKYSGEHGAEDWQASAFGSVSDVWKEAEKEIAEERKNNSTSNWGGFQGGKEMRTVTSSENKLEDIASEFRIKDLERVKDKTWERSGKRITEDCYLYLKSLYPNVTDKEVWSKAEKMARELNDQEVLNYALAKNVPKSTVEYFMRQMGDSNTLSSLMRGAGRVKAGGKTGDVSAYEQAMGLYGKDHKLARVGGSVMGMATDPTILAGGAVGNLSTKFIAGVGGKILANRGLAATTQIGVRSFLNGTSGRFLTGIAGGMGNLAFYEGASEGARQFAHGGNINPETGENEGYSGKEIGKSVGRGALLGAGMGALGTFWGKVGENASRGVNATEKALIRADRDVASFLTEGAWFAMPSIAEGDEDAMDALIDSYATVGGLKAQHKIKNVYKGLNKLRPIKPKPGKPLTLEEIRHNNMSLAERLTSSKEPGLKRHNVEELKENGYGNLADLFGGDKNNKDKNSGDKNNLSVFEIDAEGNKIYSGELAEGTINEEMAGEATDLGRGDAPLFTEKGKGGRPEFDGFSELERLMQDPNVSQETKAEAYRIVTGEDLGLETVFGYETYKDRDGNYTVETKSVRGNVVSRRKFREEKEALAYEREAYREAELNTVGIGERMVGEEHSRRIRGWIKDITGIDVGKALKKSEAHRSEAEKAAVEDYINTMYGELAKEKAQAEAEAWRAEGQELGKKLYEEAFGEGESKSPLLDENREPEAGDGQKPSGGNSEPEGGEDIKGSLEGMVARMKEAYELYEDVFGDEADYYRFHLENDPFTLANDPTLTPDQREAVLNFINSKAALDGVMEGANEAAENKMDIARQEIEHRTNKDSGMVEPAVMRIDGRPVYIIKGRVVMYPDGSDVDSENSSQTLIYMDAEDATGEYKWASIEEFSRADGAIDPEEQIREVRKTIEDEQAAILNGFEEGNIVGENIPENGNNGIKNIPPTSQDAQQEGIGRVPENADLGTSNVQNVPENVPNDPQNVPNDPQNVPNVTENVPEPTESVPTWQSTVDLFDGNKEEASTIVDAQIDQAEKAIAALQKKEPKYKNPKLSGSPLQMKEAMRKAQEEYRVAHEAWEAEVNAQQRELDQWKAVKAEASNIALAVQEARRREQEERNRVAHEQAKAEFEEEQRVKAEKEAEQAALGAHAVNPRIKEKWDKAHKIEGNADIVTLPDGSTIRGHYVLTEAGAATPSHDVNNAYAPTEGFPIDANGQSVNDRDYQRDSDAQRIVEDIAGSYDNRALQTPVIVSKDGVVLSGNNRTMSGELAAKQGTDKAYNDYLREFGSKFGFSPEAVEGFSSPRLVFVPDEDMPYDAKTFSRFNAQEMKSQSKPEAAVKLGKVVPDNVFSNIVDDISRYDRLSEFYADEKAVAQALGQLMQSGVINDKQMPELRTGTALSAAGKELIENTLIGKVFQNNPDAVRQIISIPTLRQSIVMGLSEIASNRKLAKQGYDLSDELAKAVDLVQRAKTAMPDIYAEGMPVSPFGRQAGLFDDEFGDSQVKDATTLLLADILNSGRPSDLRKVLATYNAEASQSAAGQIDMFSGDIASKEDILTQVNEHFRNATPKEQQALVDAAIAERKRRAKDSVAQSGGGNEGGEQAENALERSTETEIAGLPDNDRSRDLGHSSARREDKESVDDNGIVFVKAEDGTEIFGEIKETSGLDSAPIKLSRGYQDENGKGYGLKHIEANHGDQIRGAGFESVEEFVSFVAKNYDEDNIRVGKKRENGNPTYLISVTDSHDNTLFIELSRDGSYWNVNSAGIFRKGYSNKKETVAKTEPQQPNNAVSNGSSLSEDLEGGIASPEPNGEPTVSNSKDNTLLSEEQIISTESSGNGGVKAEDKPKGFFEEAKRIAEKAKLKRDIAEAEAQVNTEPTEAQKEAGNYKKGHVQIGTFDVTIENPKGSVRSGKDRDGKEWSVTMQHTYGYIRGTKGVDGDHIDVYVSSDIDDWNGGKVFVVDQYNPDGTFDEHKVMLGFNDKDEAYNAYLSNYEDGWENGRRIDISTTNIEDFEKWIESSKRKTKPFAEYKTIKKNEIAEDNPLDKLIKQAEESAKGYYEARDIVPIGEGTFGKIYDQFKGKFKDAINFLKRLKGGEAAGALTHHSVGDISLVWGNKKAGLEKIINKHPEVIENLQEIIDSMEVVEEGMNRIRLESPTHYAVVSKEYLGQPRDKWLLTAFEKKEKPVSASSMDIETEPLSGRENGTATLSNELSNSNSKDKENSEERQIEEDNGFTREVTEKLEAVRAVRAEYETERERAYLDEGTDILDEDASGLREKYDSLYQERRQDLLDTLQNATDEELAEVVKDPELYRMLQRALPKYEGVKEYDEIQDRLSLIELKEAGKALFEGAEPLPMVSKGLKAPKFDLYGYTSKDKDRQNLHGVYHDPETGMAVSTDTNILIAVKEGYNAENGGKIVDKKGNEIKKVIVNGKEIDAKFPNWMRIMPEGDPKTTVTLTMPKVMHLANSLREAMKGMKQKDKEGTTVALRLPDGTVGIYNIDRLAKMFEGMAKLGRGVIEYFTTGPKLAVRDAKGAILLMGYDPRRLENVDYQIDFGEKTQTSGADKPKDFFEEAERVAEEAIEKKAGQENKSQEQGEGASGSLANEPRKNYGRRMARESGKSLFDWADENEALRNGKIKEESLDPELERAGEEANRAIDEYSENFSKYLQRSEEIDKELENDGLKKIERLALEQERDMIEEVILDEKERLFESLKNFYGLNNTPEDAEMLSREMANRVQAEVSVRLNGSKLLDDLLTPAKEIVSSREPVSEMKESEGEVKTAGGPISYNARGHLPNGERGEFSYVERQFLRSGAFSFTGRDKIRDRGDVAYIFRELENYGIENVFAIMQKGDGSYKIVHIGMGSPTCSPADLTAIRAAYDAFGAEKIWFVHNHPSGVLNPSPADQQLMRKIEDAFTYLGVETEGIIMDTRSGQYSSFHGTGSSEKYARDFEMEEKPIEILAFDRMDRSNEPVEKEKLNQPYLVVNYISKMREGKEPRVSYLLLNNQMEVVGNFHTDYKDMGDSSLAEEIASVAIKYGAKAIIPYGNIELKGVGDLDLEVRQYSMGEVRIVDAMQIKEEGHLSAYDAGLMEPGSNYGKDIIGRNMTPKEASETLKFIKENPAILPEEIELTQESWEKEFGKEQKVQTPLMEVKLSENQFAKMNRKDRKMRMSLIKPTLENPDMILEENDPKEGALRDSKLLFFKIFIKPDGTRHLHFESVSVKQPGAEVVISNHEIQEKAIKEKMQNNKVLHLRGDMPFGSEMRLTETPEERPDLLPTSGKPSSESEDSENSEERQIEVKYAEMDKEIKAVEETHKTNEGNEIENNNDDLQAINERFNKELERFEKGEMTSDEFIMAGRPRGVMKNYMPDLDLMLRQRVLGKAQKKHNLKIENIKNLPGAISNPIFIFQREGGNIGVLTELKTSEGKNLFVAIDLGKTKQMGHEFLEVNDIVSIHDREVENILLPIIENGSLKYVDKEKGLQWLSSSELNPPAIAPEILNSVTNIVRNFENHDIPDENVRFSISQEEASKLGDTEQSNGEGKELQREGEGPQSDYEINMATDLIARVLGHSNKTPRQQRAWATKERRRMRAHAEELGKKLGLDIEIKDDTTTPSGQKPLSRRQQRAKGWYDVRDGKITLIVGNHSSMADIEKTILHEGVAHYGLRQLLGEHFDEFLNIVYEHSEDAIREEIDRLTDRMVEREAERLTQLDIDSLDEIPSGFIREAYKEKNRAKAEGKREEYRKTATEEFMADMAEKTDFEHAEKEIGGWLNKVKKWFIDILFKLGFKHITGKVLGLNELRYILWRSYQNLRYPGRYRGFEWEAEDVTMRHKTGVLKDQYPEEGSNNISRVAERAEKRARIEKLRNSESVEITGEEIKYSPDEKEFKKNALEYGKKLQGSYLNEDQGKEIQLQRGRHNGGLKEVLQHDIHDEAHIKSIAAIPEIIRKSIYIDTKANIDLEKNPDVRAYEHYVSGLKIGGEDYTVHSIIAEDKNGERYYDHKLSHIEKGKLLDFIEAKQPTEQILAPMPDTKSTIRSQRKVKELIDILQVPEEEDNLLFRDGDDLKDVVERMRNEAEQANADNLEAKKEAVRALNGNMNKLRRAMARQREYDVATVKSVTDLAKTLMDSGLLEDLSKKELKTLLFAIEGVVGRQDVSKLVQRVVDIMIDNQLRNTKEALDEIEKRKGDRLDSRGIRVGAGLDPEGERMRKLYKENKDLTPAEILKKIQKAENDMGSEVGSIASRATTDHSALQIALAYSEDVTGNKKAEKELREGLREAKEEKEAGRISAEAYRQYRKAVEEDIREKKIARLEAYNRIMDMLTEEFSESAARALEWKEADRERIRHIHHLANADMEGREMMGDDKRNKSIDKFLNGPVGYGIFGPLSTFDQMLKMIGSHSPDGMGYLYNYYMRAYVDAIDNEQKQKEQWLKMLDDKAAEKFGEKRHGRNGYLVNSPYSFSDVYEYADSVKTLKVTYYDGVKKREVELPQKAMMYLYSVDKMPNGAATNRRMGITEEMMEQITETIDPKLRDYADWVQEVLFQEVGLSADEVYQKMFGAHMQLIDNYFPFERDRNAIKKEVEVGENEGYADKITTQTRSIKERNGSTAKWKPLEELDWFESVPSHLNEQAHWQSFARLNLDLGTLLSYPPFRQKLMNIRSVYGSGESLMRTFEDVCAIATDCYQPKTSRSDKAIVNIAKGVSTGKISFRIFTACKQVLSLPAFFGEISVKDLMTDLASGGIIALKWAWKNMPNFRKRVLSRTSGNYMLNETTFDKELNKASSLLKKGLNWVKKLGEFGMLPNVGVDAWTIAIGSHGAYQKAKRKYLRWGIDENRAEQMAIQDAEICYNKSQQSSEGAFMAPIQVDHTWWATSAMLFRNSSTSYTREAHTASRNLRNLMTGKVTVDGVTKQILRKMDIKPYNERFNEELKQQIAGTLPTGHIYQLGKPGAILLIGGFPDAPMELSSTRLAEKANQANHVFPIAAVKGLVDALNRPLAIFEYGNNARNVIVGLTHQGKQFLVGVHFNQNRGGSEVSSIRGLFPKDNAEWLNWISQGKATYLDHKKIQDIIDKQRINLADVAYLDLEDVANVMNNFENPEKPDIKNDPRWSKEDWDKARKFAKEEIRRGYIRNGANLAMFGWILPYLWRLGAVSASLVLLGGKEEKKKKLEEAAKMSVFAPIEGLMYGDVAVDLLNMGTGLTDMEWKNIGRTNPILSDIVEASKRMDYDTVRGFHDIFNILIGMGTGVNPQTAIDIAVAIEDYLGDDARGKKECALLIARILNCPPSQLEDLYFEEVGLTGEEAAKMLASPQEIAERYARYRNSRETYGFGWMRSEEAKDSAMEKKKKVVLDKAEEKISGRMTTAETKRLLEEYDLYNKDRKSYQDLKDEDEAAYWEARKAFYEKWGGDGLRRHRRIQAYKRDIKQMTDSLLSKSISVEEMQEIVNRMIRAREVLLEDMSK